MSNNFDNLALFDYVYSQCFEQLDNGPTISPLKSVEEEVKEGTGIKILTPIKILNRLLVLMAQTKPVSSY